MEPDFTLLPCRTFRQRLLGVYGFGPLGEGQGLWIIPCRAVHTLGLTQTLDVVFLDAHDQPLRVCARLAPNRAAWCWGAASVVELPGGFCQRHADSALRIARQCAALRQRWQTGARAGSPARQKRSRN